MPTIAMRAMAFLAGLLALAVVPSKAQDVTAFQNALSGEWFTFDPDFSSGATCRLDLDQQASGERLSARSTDCAGTLTGVTTWAIVDNQLGLFADGAEPVALLGGNQLRVSGEFSSDGRPLILERAQGDGNNVRLAGAIRAHGCIFRGFSQDCADDGEFVKPETGGDSGSIAEVQVLANVNVRAQPRRDAAILGTVPINTCLRVNACLRASDGIWCRARFGEDNGWLSKTAIRRDQWAVMTYKNGCEASNATGG